MISSMKKNQLFLGTNLHIFHLHFKLTTRENVFIYRVEIRRGLGKEDRHAGRKDGRGRRNGREAGKGMNGGKEGNE